ncbi:hypothetical protein [Scytonema sp. UIC 10036]|nr:hypothetical protein [Scytonema sp. UIC 10036]
MKAVREELSGLSVEKIADLQLALSIFGSLSVLLYLTRAVQLAQ